MLKKSIYFCFIILIISCAKKIENDVSVINDLGPTVILISLDGFRWDYLSKTDTPNLDILVENGVISESLIPVFPSKTFPNHLSIVTGCYPENHGILSNNMYDQEWDAEYYIGENSDPVKDGRWYDAEPIWVTAEKQGKLTGTYFWPGSEAEINGTRPSYYGVYDGNISREDRVQKILEWIDLPKQSRPVFMTLYFSDVDSWGHNIGPDAIGMNSIIKEIDESIGLLVSGLNKREILDNINIIITSDHGMAGLSRDRVIFLDDYININDVRMVDWSPVAMILPEDDSIVSTYSALYDAHPQMSVFKKEDVPARLHFNNHRRIPPIICIAADGWSISDRDYFDENPYSFTGGTHGYEPINKSMHGIFIASGPELKRGLTIDSFSSIHIYEVIAHILDIDTPENDASFDSISVMFK
tara:strand:+ start:183 stop:1424 length:1242 start_codon:yes stop_codon:yes gene_type:complete